MDFLADILLATGALAAAFYCFVLARRLTRFTDLETGVGGAVAVLSAQVDDLARTLAAAREAAGTSTSSLEDLTARAEDVAKRLELMVASMHDLPEQAPRSDPRPQAPAESPAAAAPSGPVFSRRTRHGGTG